MRLLARVIKFCMIFFHVKNLFFEKSWNKCLMTIYNKEIIKRNIQCVYGSGEEFFMRNLRENLLENLLEQGVWEHEADEILTMFNETATKEDMQIETIFDSAYELGKYYVDAILFGTLDYNIEAVLDYEKLGKHLSETQEKYEMLHSGRIVEFKLQR